MTNRYCYSAYIECTVFARMHLMGNVVQPADVHCVQIGGPRKPTFQSWSQKSNTMRLGQEGKKLGGAANEAVKPADNNAKIVKLKACAQLKDGATALMATKEIGQDEEILVDYGDAFAWAHRREHNSDSDGEAIDAE